MSKGLFHVHLLRIIPEKAPDERWIDMLDRDNEVRRHNFGGIDQKEWPVAVFVFDPKRDDVIPAVEFAIDSNAAFRNFEMRKFWWGTREKPERDRREDDEYTKEEVVEDDGD